MTNASQSHQVGSTSQSLGTDLSKQAQPEQKQADPQPDNIAVMQDTSGNKVVIDQKQLELLKELLQKEDEKKQREKEKELE